MELSRWVSRLTVSKVVAPSHGAVAEAMGLMERPEVVRRQWLVG
jgi:hypothetical protein